MTHKKTNNFSYLNAFLTMVLLFLCPAQILAYVSILNDKSSSSFEFTTVETARFDHVLGVQRGGGDTSFVGQYVYIDKPLIEKQADGQTNILVHNIHSFGLRPGVFLGQRTLIHFGVTMNSIDMGSNNTKYGLGDSDLQLKHRLTPNSDRFALAVIPQLYFPTGNQNIYLSNHTFGWALSLAMDRKFGPVKLALNLGYRNYANGASWETINYSSQAIGAIGADIQLSSRWSVNTEANGQFSLPPSRMNSPGEYYIGGKFKTSSSEVFYVGLSLAGSPVNKTLSPGIIAGIKVLPFAERVHADTPVHYARDSDRDQACSTKPFSVRYFSRALKSSELRKTLLPYKTSKNKTVHERIETLALGQMTGITDNALPWVENSQIPFAIDLIELPPRDTIVRIEKASLKMNVKKVSKDPYLSTEIICFTNPQVCSGELISSPSWQSVVNKKFFNGTKGVVNRYFAKQYLGKSVGQVEGQKIYAAELNIDLERLLRKSGVTPIDLIYANFPTDKTLKKKTLKLVVADDTFISNDVMLELTMTVKDCK